jgi:tRNA A-37 threonylcarbamoyl transferase component Bud32
MPQWLLNTLVGFFLSLLAVALTTFVVGEGRRAQQGVVSDPRASKRMIRIAAALLMMLLATTIAMVPLVSAWFLLVPIPSIVLMLPTMFPISSGNKSLHLTDEAAIKRAMWDMAIIGSWILETGGFEYTTWFQTMLSDQSVNPALREYALGIEERLLARVYNWSRAILVGAYLVKLSGNDFTSWQTRLLATLDKTTREDLAPFITELRQAAIELQANLGRGKRLDQILSILANEQATEVLIGRVVGNYRILEMIGEGGMGTVFRATELMVERDVAIKVLRRDFVRQAEIVERFISEANALARLNHPNIATLYNFFREGDDLFMVMELVGGETLASLLGRHGPVHYQQATEQFCQILEGIGYAHNRGIVHRDIKPSNVILTDSGMVKVMDFGIARVAGTERQTRLGNIIGTLEYMSPEQIQGREVDLRSDIYSLGVLLFEILTGRLPFIGNEYELIQYHVHKEPPPARLFVPEIPPQVEQAILRALAKNPEARFQTVGEFRQALSTKVASR